VYGYIKIKLVFLFNNYGIRSILVILVDNTLFPLLKRVNHFLKIVPQAPAGGGIAPAKWRCQIDLKG
jgi:hypothetical protein